MYVCGEAKGFGSLLLFCFGVMNKERICKNCLNAYNIRTLGEVHCWNKDFDAQFDDVPTQVHKNDTCGRFTERNDNQERLLFDQPIQLTLF